MKNLLLIFLVLLSNSLSAVEYGVIYGSNSYTQTADMGPFEFFPNQSVEVNDDEILEILHFNHSSVSQMNNNPFRIMLVDSNIEIGSDNSPSPNNMIEYPNAQILEGRHNNSSYSNTNSISNYEGVQVVGPCILYISYRNMMSSSYGDEAARMSYKITKTRGSLQTPLNTVVIPSDSSGPVQIILESSEDMVNWNSANPGTYGASTNERFFRIRAVQETD